MKWGLVLHYSKFEDKNLNTNARAENLVEGGGIWASLKGPKRCVVSCQGYYEWLTKGKNKLPHFIKPKDGPGGSCSWLACMILSFYTAKPRRCRPSLSLPRPPSSNSSFSWLHERQLVILHTAEALDAWLDTSSLKWSSDLILLLTPTTHALDWFVFPLSFATTRILAQS
ncbi:LigB domain-containing protein [Mycena sanguinolenta]|uniref:LigB domain-containing protein n=1 Tax=Mycena sanguinolenta TaxID=230812 RepID=A0A8H7DHK4_9AGAR|nr:LigB domain-containing protein [Mycena sanguinolenta]